MASREGAPHHQTRDTLSEALFESQLCVCARRPDLWAIIHRDVPTLQRSELANQSWKEDANRTFRIRSR